MSSSARPRLPFELSVVDSNVSECPTILATTSVSHSSHTTSLGEQRLMVIPATSTKGVKELWEEALKEFYGETIRVEDQYRASTIADIVSKINKDNKSFGKWRHDDGCLDSLRTLVKNGLGPINTIGNVIASAVSPIFPPSTAVYSALTILISTSNSVSGDFDALVTLFTELGNFLKIFGILETSLTSVPSIEAVQKALVAALKSILSVCNVAKTFEKGRIRHGIREFFGKDGGLKDARTSFQEATKQVNDSLVAKVYVNSELQEQERQKASKTASLRDSLEIVRLHFTTQVDPSADWAITKPELPLTEIRRSSIVETGQWILSKPEYIEWSLEKTRILRISGEPGTEKSHIASAIIKDLSKQVQSHTRAVTAYFFFKFTSPQTRSVENALRSSVIQIAQTDEIFRERVARKLDTDGLGLDSPMSKKNIVNELWNRWFATEFSEDSEGTLWLVLDGLDEADDDERDQLAKHFIELGKSSIRIQVVILGRPEVQSAFDAGDASSQRSISIINEDNKSDIRALVNATYRSMDEFRAFKGHLRPKIVKAVAKASQGALLYVKPVLLLLSSYGAASVEDELKNLPKGQDQMYEMVLERISEKAPSPEQPLIKSLLSLVLHVKEPLSFRELQSLYETKTQYSIPKLIKIRCSSIFSWREPVSDKSDDDRNWDESESDAEYEDDESSSDSDDLLSEDSEAEGDETSFESEKKNANGKAIQKREEKKEDEEEKENDEENDSDEEEDYEEDEETSRIRVELLHASLRDYLSSAEIMEKHPPLVTSRSDSNFEMALLTLKATCDRTTGGRFFRKYAFAHWFDHLGDVNINLCTEDQVEKIITSVIELVQKSEPPITLKNNQIYSYLTLGLNSDPSNRVQDLLLNWLKKGSVVSQKSPTPFIKATIDRLIEQPLTLWIRMTASFAKQWLEADFLDEKFNGLDFFQRALSLIVTTNLVPLINPNQFHSKKGILFFDILSVADAFPQIERDCVAHRQIAATAANWLLFSEGMKELELAFTKSETDLEKFNTGVAVSWLEGKQRNYTAACRKLEETLESYSIENSKKELGRAVFMLGDFYAVQDDYTKALKAFERGMDVSPIPYGYLSNEVLVCLNALGVEHYSRIVDEFKNLGDDRQRQWLSRFSVSDREVDASLYHEIIQRAAVATNVDPSTSTVDTVIECYLSAIEKLQGSGPEFLLRYQLAKAYKGPFGNTHKAIDQYQIICEDKDRTLSKLASKHKLYHDISRFSRGDISSLCCDSRVISPTSTKSMLKDKLETILELRSPEQLDLVYNEEFANTRLERQISIFVPDMKSLLRPNFRFAMQALQDATGSNDIEGFRSLAITLAIAGFQRLAEISFLAMLSNVNPQAFKYDHFTNSENQKEDNNTEKHSWKLDEDLIRPGATCDCGGEGIFDMSKTVYQCLDCFKLLCETCYKRLFLEDNLRRSYACDPSHQFLQAPIDDWGGVKDGTITIGGSRIQLEDWLKEVERAWEQGD